MIVLKPVRSLNKRAELYATALSYLHEVFSERQKKKFKKQFLAIQKEYQSPLYRAVIKAAYAKTLLPKKNYIR